MGSGNHIPDFGDVDPLDGGIVTFNPTTAVPTTPAPTSAPATEVPVTPAPGVTSLGTRVAGTFTYRPGEKKLVGRCWAELVNKRLATRALQPAQCTLELFQEDGTLVKGVPIKGRSDALDHKHVMFFVENFVPEESHNYICRVTLKTANGETLFPRTFPMPVN